LTWTPLTFQPQLPDPGCESSLISLAAVGLGPDTFLFAGITRDHLEQNGVSKHARHRLAAFLSSDGCRNWHEVGVIQPSYAAYSDLVALTDGTILCFYDGAAVAGVPNRTIRWARFDRDWLRRSPAQAR